MATELPPDWYPANQTGSVPGANVANPPPLSPVAPIPAQPVPDSWARFQDVAQRIFVIAQANTALAQEIWAEYRRLSGS